MKNKKRNHVFILLLMICSTAFIKAQTIGSSSTSANQGVNPWKLSLGSTPRPKGARTLIDAEESARFDDNSNTIEFVGKVVVRDPQFTLFCDKLTVVLNKNRQGLKLVTATGNVIVEQENINEQGVPVKSIGKAGEAVYEPATGDVALKIWPQMQQGMNYQVATEEKTVMILNNKGTSHTIGQSRVMIIDQDKTGEANE
ncbi:MAG: LptA/OstA family protein [Chthoniobacterales bacterium]